MAFPTTVAVDPPIFPCMDSRNCPATEFTSTAIRYSMFAPFVGLVGRTSIVQRKRAGTHQVGESTKGGGVSVFHGDHFSPSEPINANQLCGDVL